jgi:hypothetical protein
MNRVFTKKSRKRHFHSPGGLHVLMQPPGDSGPFGSAEHRPVVVLQLYITGVGGGVGGAVCLQVAMQPPGDSWPFGSAAHCPVVALQLNMMGVGTGVGGLV